MSIEPFVKCSSVADSIAFYCETLDFEVHTWPDPDPTAFMSKYGSISREGALVHLSAHAGDGVFGNVVYVRVDDIAELYEKLIARGLAKPQDGESAGLTMVPVDQTWGMREFSVRDPDGNRMTFGQAIG